MKRLVSRILQSECFKSEPPVLLDIGASGGLPHAWKNLAPYSVGIGFDADARDFTTKEASGRRGWKRLHLLNSLVTAQAGEAVDFYLTQSPHCSSTLEPLSDALRPWAFRELFKVVQTVKLPALDLPSALAEAGVDRIDWFKCDSQGTDLRLFRSLPLEMQSRVLAAEFEPGIISAYRGEDKLPQLMTYMDQLPFWVDSMTIKGSQRVGDLDLESAPRIQKKLSRSIYATSPGWCEISYLNTCDSGEVSQRDLLLAIVFALAKVQYGFAADLARRGTKKFSSPLFAEVQDAVDRQLKLNRLRAPFAITTRFIRRRL
jgi:hypothetical protein